jgi:hypothetical protein
MNVSRHNETSFILHLNSWTVEANIFKWHEFHRIKRPKHLIFQFSGLLTGLPSSERIPYKTLEYSDQSITPSITISIYVAAKVWDKKLAKQCTETDVQFELTWEASDERNESVGYVAFYYVTLCYIMLGYVPSEFSICRVTAVFLLLVWVRMCFTEHHAMKAYWESGGTALRLLDLGTD